jgi:hypothetical protein
MNKKRDKHPDGSNPSSIVDTEKWQIGEAQAGLADLDAEQAVSHARSRDGWSRGGGLTKNDPRDQGEAGEVLAALGIK